MKHTICCIDDKIPASAFPDFFDDTKLLDGQVIRFLLKSKDVEWEDSVIKELFSVLLNDPEWLVTAFTAPEFYDNYNEEVVFSPDVIVYDWDYNGKPGNTEESLLNILQNSYSIVFILSGSDQIEEIVSVVNEGGFKRYHNRLSVVPKEKDVSVNKIINSFRQKEDSLFTYRCGYDLVRKSNKAINGILSDISLLSIQGLLSTIGGRDNEDIVASNEDFLDAMIPRFRKALSSINIEGYRKKHEPEEVDINQIKDIWRYRLYDDKFSDTVSMGDIVFHPDDNQYYLVFSSDCHMNNLWQKNGGYISLIPLLRIDDKETKELIKMIDPKGGNLSFSSIASSQHAVTVLPAVPVDKETIVDFVAFPKGIRSVRVSKLTEGQENKFKYKYWKDFKRVVSVLDPFKSPLIQYLLDHITGYGCPDFHPELSKYIKNAIK